MSQSAIASMNESNIACGAPKRRRWGSFRPLHLVIFWFVGWPLLSILLGAFYTLNAPTTRGVPVGIALAGNAAGMLYLVPEFLVSGIILFALSWIVYSVFPPAEAEPSRKYLFEPTIAFFGVSLGISLEFPGILNNSIFSPIQPLPLIAGWLVMFAFLLLLAALRNGLRHRNLMTVLAPVVIFVVFGWGLTRLPIAEPRDSVNKGSTVILGVDSMGLLSDIGPLYNFTRQSGGAWYERAVTPGLLTNAVWTAIVEHRPIHETGTTLIFQTPDWNRSPFQLVREARNHGYQTWSYFTGQNTIYIGSMGGFEYDHSGPMGWLDNATVGAKNGSIFVSFFASRLPRLPFSQIRRNQAGTYAFDLRSTVHSIFTRHEGSRPVFAVAHLGYLHDDCYPHFAELSSVERRLLLTARIDSLKDSGSEWQILPIQGDRLDLRNWKNRRIQSVIIDELRRSGFLEAANHNRLVILSDHGVRAGLTVDNFNNESYYRVPLITFGLPVRDVNTPISLLDISSLVGMEDHSSPEPADPVVEYVNFRGPFEYVGQIKAAKWTADGRITYRPGTENAYLNLLRSYSPYPLAPEQSAHQSQLGQAPSHRELSSTAKSPLHSAVPPQ